MSNNFLNCQVCILAYSDKFRLRRDSLEFASVVQQFCQRLGVRLTNFAYHTREDLEDEAEEFSYEADNLGRLKQWSAQEPILDVMFWSSDDSYDPAWQIYA